MKSYLPGLNFLRIYAALCVIFIHSTGQSSPLFLSGWNAVTLFFVLSGYLITYKLLYERKAHGRINLKAFYIRRELRILPLYYLALLIALLLSFVGAPAVMPASFAAAFLLMPQVAHAFTNLTGLGLAGHLYSIGVEELFYFIFPFLMCHFSMKRLCMTVIVICTLIGGLAYEGGGAQWGLLFGFMRFECMGVGALTAYTLVTQSKWLARLYHPTTQLVAFAGIGATLLNLPLPIPDLTFSICAAILLVNISTNPHSLIKLEWRWSRVLGELTYGVYIYHFALLWILGRIIPASVLFPVTVTVTFAVAALSYRYLEKPITGMKDRLYPVSRPSSSTILA